MSEAAQWRSRLLWRIAARFASCFGVRLEHRDEGRLRAAVEQRCEGVEMMAFLEQILAEEGCDLLEPLLDAFTIKETYFFREPRQFQVIESTILPELIAGREPGHLMRVMSAGCATGEEAYSLAAMLHQHGLLRRSHVFGVDVSEEALEKARRGLYSDWSVRQEASRRILSYADREDGQWRLRPTLLTQVDYELLNLVDAEAVRGWSARHGELDLILCRNVLIYFSDVHVEQVARTLFEMLAPGGVLFVGSSDPMLHKLAPFEVRLEQGLLVYQRPAHSLRAPTLELSPPPPPPQPERRRSRPRRRPPEPRDEASGDDEDAAPFLHLSELATASPQRALKRCEALLAEHPLSLELRRLQATLLLGLGRYKAAGSVAKKMIYLDHKAVIGHLLEATAASCSHDREASARAFRNVVALLEGLPDERVVPHTDGETVGMLRAAARRHCEAEGRRDE